MVDVRDDMLPSRTDEVSRLAGFSDAGSTDARLYTHGMIASRLGCSNPIEQQVAF